jgi:hypothetical protein
MTLKSTFLHFGVYLAMSGIMEHVSEEEHEERAKKLKVQKVKRIN